MRIIHVFSAPQSAYFFLDKQLQFMVKNGCEIHVVIPNDGYYGPEFMKRETNVKVHFVEIKRRISLFQDLKSLFKLYFLFKSVKADIVHLHTPKASFIGVIAARLSFHKKIIYQMHGLVSANGNLVKKNLIYYIERTTCMLATKVFAVSKSLRLFAIQNNYCKEDKISVIGNGTINGIEYKNKFNPYKIINSKKYLKSEVLKDKFIVGFVGRISEDKGIRDYIKVLELLKLNIPVLGVMVGANECDQTLFEILKNSKSSLTKDDVITIDNILDVENVICDFDVLLFPTKREGFGLVASEANAMLKPVVSYDIPGVKDAVENYETAILVEFGDFIALKDACLLYYLDSRILKLHGENGRTRVKRLFDQNNLWNELLKEYKNLEQNVQHMY